MLVTLRESEVLSPSDETELVNAVRAGDLDAYGLIYRRHAAAALACALNHCRSRCVAEDVRAEAFTAMLAAIRAGRGPRGPVLPYLRTAIRRIAAEWRRREARMIASGDGRDFEVSDPEADTAVAHSELSIVAEAFMTLPDRWRVVLRLTVIEAEGPARLCGLFGVNAAAVAALAYRAREGLRETYLQAHIRHLAHDACRLYAERLGAYTRGRVGRSQRQRIEDHLAACVGCAKLFWMLCCINSTMARNRAPHRHRTR